MRNCYNAKLDRMIDHDFPRSHDFLMDEIELGARVALAIGDPEQWIWALWEEELWADAR